MRQTIIINYISFFAVDTGGNLVSVKLASQKHGIFESGLLENVSIINLSKFQVIYFEYDEVSNLEPTNLMILALDLTVVGKKDQIFSEDILKKKRLAIQKADVTVTDLEEVSDSPLPFTQLDTTEFEEKQEDPTLTYMKCDGTVCSVYGVHFNQCVCLSHPVNRIDLEGLVSQCHFLDGQSYEGMVNKGKRLAYY